MNQDKKQAIENAVLIIERALKVAEENGDEIYIEIFQDLHEQLRVLTKGESLTSVDMINISQLLLRVFEFLKDL